MLAFEAEELLTSAPTPNCITTPCPLLVTAYSIHSLAPAVPGWRHTYLQPEIASCHGVWGQLNMGFVVKHGICDPPQIICTIYPLRKKTLDSKWRINWTTCMFIFPPISFVISADLYFHILFTYIMNKFSHCIQAQRIKGNSRHYRNELVFLPSI